MGKINDAAILSDEVAGILGPGPFRDLSLYIEPDQVDALTGPHLFSRNDLVRVLFVHSQGDPQMVVVGDGNALNASSQGSPKEGFRIRQTVP
jgi:hypothetical protein